MTAFQMSVSQNQFLSKDADMVHAIVSVSSAAGEGGPARAQRLVEALLLDCSGSMDGEKIRHARDALCTAVGLLTPDAWFCVIAGNEKGRVAVPLCPATDDNKRRAVDAIRRLQAAGGTAMSTWLSAARHEFDKRPDAIHHALLLTDGKNEGESDQYLNGVLAECEGQFQCDARGIGTDWKREQLRLIAGRLLGSVDIIPSPGEIEAEFQKVIRSALGKSIREAVLRLWAPVGAAVEFCKQVYPEKVDLTPRCVIQPATPQIREYPTGSWGEEKREYHLCLKVVPGKVGQRMCAGRVSLIVREAGQETKAAESMVLAVWTEDEGQTAVINSEVAHYTGQAELADAIQQGLQARATGDEDRATKLLGRAVQIAAVNNPETMKLLRKVVEVENEQQGTVKLRAGVKKEDEFALDTRSVKTARVKK